MTNWSAIQSTLLDQQDRLADARDEFFREIGRAHV